MKNKQGELALPDFKTYSKRQALDPEPGLFSHGRKTKVRIPLTFFQVPKAGSPRKEKK